MNHQILFRNKIWQLFVAVTALLIIATAGYAETQQVSFTPENVVALSNESLTFQLIYNVEGMKEKTTGIGIRIHYDSTVVDTITLTDVYGEGVVGADNIPQEDTGDFDSDASTDKYIVVAWAGISGKWPTFVSLPGTIATVNIVVKKDAPNRESKMNITSAGNASGYDFSGKSALILVQ